MLKNIPLAFANLEDSKSHSLMSFLGLNTLTALISHPTEPLYGRDVESQGHLTQETLSSLL